LTVAGTVRTLVLLELSVTLTPVGEAADKFSVRFCVPPAPMVRLLGEKLSAAPTLTV